MNEGLRLLVSLCLFCYLTSDAFTISSNKNLMPVRTSNGGDRLIGSTQQQQKHSSLVILRMEDDSAPSDYDADDLVEAERHATVDTDEDDAIIRDELKRELLLLASVTNRGEYASSDEKDSIVDMVTQLEALNPTANPAKLCVGEWDLCLTSTQSFRSSPFFQSIRALFQDDDENKAIAENGFNMHALATSTGKVKRVRQRIEVGENGLNNNDLTLTSLVDIEVGIFPSVPASLKGTVVTTASIRVVSSELWEMYVKGTKVIRSNIPFLDQLLDDYPLEIPVGDIYQTLRGDVPSADIKTLYVDESMRIARDVDDNFYIFTRV